MLFVVLPIPGPGIVFGLMVVWPYCARAKISGLRTAFSIFFSPVAYCVAVMFFMDRSPWGFGLVSGGMGAAITFLPVFMGRTLDDLQRFASLVITGATAAMVAWAIIIGIQNLHLGSMEFMSTIVVSIMLWQVAISLVLACSLSDATAADSEECAQSSNTSRQ